MRLFADEQDRAPGLVARPDREVEGHAAEHRDDDRGDFRRHARHVDDRDRLAAARHAEDAGEEICHRIGNEHAGEHEAVARIGLDLFDLGLEPEIGGGVAGAIHLAHFEADEIGEVAEQIGDRRVDGELGDALAQAILAARHQQALRQDVAVELAVFAAGGDEDLAMLLEVHQPIGHLEIVDVVQRAVVAEGGAIFAVRIDHQHMALRRQFADAVEDQRGAGRFAGAGRTHEREMLAEHRVDVERGAHVAGRIDGADLDMRAVAGRIDLLKVGGGDRKDLAPRNRIARHAAAEAVQTAGQLLLHAFAEEVDFGRDPVARSVAQRQAADVGDQPRLADAHLDLGADLARAGGHRIGSLRGQGQRIAVEQHAAAAARDRQDATDRCAGQADRFLHVRRAQRRTLRKRTRPRHIVHHARSPFIPDQR